MPVTVGCSSGTELEELAVGDFVFVERPWNGEALEAAVVKLIERGE
jgi:hypothetical protein